MKFYQELPVKLMEFHEISWNFQGITELSNDFSMKFMNFMKFQWFGNHIPVIFPMI